MADQALGNVGDFFKGFSDDVKNKGFGEALGDAFGKVKAGGWAGGVLGLLGALLIGNIFGGGGMLGIILGLMLVPLGIMIGNQQFGESINTALAPTAPAAKPSQTVKVARNPDITRQASLTPAEARAAANPNIDGTAFHEAALAAAQPLASQAGAATEADQNRIRLAFVSNFQAQVGAQIPEAELFNRR